MISFEESGMRFGPFEDGDCFRVEKSRTYKALGEGVKVVEFILLRKSDGRPPQLWIVEAKRSSPYPALPEKCAVCGQSKPSDHDDFVAGVRCKMIDSLTLGFTSILGRHPSAIAELPASFRDIDLAKVDIRLVLVVNGHKPDWLTPLRDALRSALRGTTAAWQLGPIAILVLNDDNARRMRLIE